MSRTVVDDTRPDLGGNGRHGDLGTFCPRLWRYLVERFAVRSMLDVGCGEGHAVAFFRSLGVIAHGIDGLPINIKRAVTPIALHDIVSGPYIMPVDLVWSCEVAEHIQEDKVDNYIRTLANGTIIAMTHAMPDQPGHHHVNNQPPEYWIEKMRSIGYDLDPYNGVYVTISKRDELESYFSRSGLVFHRMVD
jgi:SAM-dependent methyltransferase